MKTATIEQSKRIKELGVEIDSYFVWDKLPNKNDWWIQPRWMVEDDSMAMISAPIAEEMMDRMPSTCDIEYEGHKKMCLLRIGKILNEYQIEYSIKFTDYDLQTVQTFKPIFFVNQSLSEACADMLIWLSENKYLEDDG